MPHLLIFRLAFYSGKPIITGYMNGQAGTLLSARGQPTQTTKDKLMKTMHLAALMGGFFVGIFFAVNSHAQPPATTKAVADKVEEIKGHVLQMVNGVNGVNAGMLIEARRNKATEPRRYEIVCVVNYPGHKLREGRAIVVSAIPVGTYRYTNLLNAPMSVTKYDATLPPEVVQYLMGQGITVYPTFVYQR